MFLIIQNKPLNLKNKSILKKTFILFHNWIFLCLKVINVCFKFIISFKTQHKDANNHVNYCTDYQIPIPFHFKSMIKKYIYINIHLKWSVDDEIYVKVLCWLKVYRFIWVIKNKIFQQNCFGGSTFSAFSKGQKSKFWKTLETKKMLYNTFKCSKL